MGFAPCVAVRFTTLVHACLLCAGRGYSAVLLDGVVQLIQYPSFAFSVQNSCFALDATSRTACYVRISA